MTDKERAEMKALVQAWLQPSMPAKKIWGTVFVVLISALAGMVFTLLVMRVAGWLWL